MQARFGWKSLAIVAVSLVLVSRVAGAQPGSPEPATGDAHRVEVSTSSWAFNDAPRSFENQILASFESISTKGNISSVDHSKRDNFNSRTKYEAGRDDLRSLLTLPSAAVPNDITFRPRLFSSTGGSQSDSGRAIRLDVSRTVIVARPYLMAGIGTLVGGFANMRAAGYTLSEFRLGFNSWDSEKTAAREQGADMVQHFILGYGLTRYFLDNGSSVVGAGISAFTYEFVAGEVMECFPQAGGISVRDVAVNLMAVTVGMIDHEHDSPIRFWAGSNITVKPSAPSEFDPYHIGLGVAVGRVAGLEFICSFENWKDPLPRHPDLDDPQETTQAYFVERL